LTGNRNKVVVGSSSYPLFHGISGVVRDILMQTARGVVMYGMEVNGKENGR
jgi:hypothetical protein